MMSEDNNKKESKYVIEFQETVSKKAVEVAVKTVLPILDSAGVIYFPDPKDPKKSLAGDDLKNKLDNLSFDEAMNIFAKFNHEIKEVPDDKADPANNEMKKTDRAKIVKEIDTIEAEGIAIVKSYLSDPNLNPVDAAKLGMNPDYANALLFIKQDPNKLFDKVHFDVMIDQSKQEKDDIKIFREEKIRLLDLSKLYLETFKDELNKEENKEIKQMLEETKNGIATADDPKKLRIWGKFLLNLIGSILTLGILLGRDETRKTVFHPVRSAQFNKIRDEFTKTKQAVSKLYKNQPAK